MDPSILDKLVLQEFYVHPTGLLTSATDFDDPLQANSNLPHTWGRIKIITSDISKDYTTLAVAAYPSRNWSLNEFFFTAEPAVIGALEFNCSNGAQEKAFVVVVGIYQIKAWCEVLPNLEHSSLEDIYSEKTVVLTSNHQYSSLLDMAVCFVWTAIGALLRLSASCLVKRSRYHMHSMSMDALWNSSTHGLVCTYVSVVEWQLLARW